MTAARRAVLAPAALLFAIMAAHALLETARDALFLARLGPELLAFAYIAIAVVAMFGVGAVRKWDSKRHPRRMLLMFLAAATLGTIALSIVIAARQSAVFALYVWTGLVATVVVPAFWTLIDRSLRIAEAKRVFAIIGAGGILGAIVGSALAALLGTLIAPQHLVTAGAIAFGVTTVAGFALAPKPSGDDEPIVRKRVVEKLSQVSRRFVRLLIVVGVLSTIALTLTDLTFKRVLSHHIEAGDMAMVFGAIYTGLNVIALVIQLAVTSRLLQHWGVAAALTVLPILIVASASGFVLTGAVFAIIALKLADGGLRHSLHRVGSEILFLPVPSHVRDGWKPIADAISQRGGQTLAALIALALASFGAGSRSMAAVLAIVSIGWLVTISVVRRAYVTQFRDTLRAGDIERDASVPELDSDSVNLLTEALASPDELEALAALELLARGRQIPALVLYHPCDRVVRRALALLGAKLRPETVRVLGHLIAHSDPKIRAAALFAASRSGSNREQLVSALSDSDADVRAAALVGLSDDRELAAEVNKGLSALLGGSTEDRIALAHAIGYAPRERFRRLLYQLLSYEEPPVMREVLRALAAAPALADVDRLLALLEDPHVRGEVRRVFTAVGARGFTKLVAALDDPRTPIDVRRHLPRSIMRFKSRAAAAALVARLLREPDGATEYKLLRALGRMRENNPKLVIDEEAVHEYLRLTIRDAARYATFLDELNTEGDRSASAQLLRELLEEKLRYAIEHAFRALGILYPRHDLRSVHAAFVGTEEALRAAAVEIASSIVPLDCRAPLFAVLDPITPQERRERLGELAVGPFDSYASLLLALLADPSESLKCIVAYHIAERNLVGLRNDLVRMRPLASRPLVISSFDQAIARLHG